MRGQKWRAVSHFLWISLVFVLTTGGFSHAEEGSDDKLFPFSRELKGRIAFWKKIFTEYDSNQVLIHDAEGLNIVYEVVDLKAVFGEKTTREATKAQLIEQVKAAYRDILRGMAAGLIDPSALSKREYRVYQLFEGVEDRDTLLRAAESVRSQRGLRDRFLRGLIVSGRYNHALQEIFRNHGLPEKLIAIPHIESNFDHRAYSRKGAAGAWQFIRSTGQQFLRIDSEVDERLDPLFAGQAAARLLQKNYEILGSWPLAITAYNHGRQGMLNAVRGTGSDSLVEIITRYQGPNFGFASKNFYAEFLAAVEVIKSPQRYFGEVKPHPSLEYDLVQIPRPVGLGTILRHFDLSREGLAEYNPALLPPVWGGRSPVPAGFLLRLPKGKSDQVPTFLARLSSDDSPSQGRVAKVRGKAFWYRVKRGDTLLAVARWFDTDLRALRLLNGLEKSGRIQAGQLLRLPANARYGKDGESRDKALSKGKKGQSKTRVAPPSGKKKKGK